MKKDLDNFRGALESIAIFGAGMQWGFLGMVGMVINIVLIRLFQSKI